MSCNSACRALSRFQAISNERDVDLDQLVDGRRVDIEMDLLRMRAEVLQAAGHAIVEARTDADHQIGVMHCQIRFQRAVHAQHPHELGIRRRECAQAHQRQGAGGAGVPNEPGKGLACGRTGIDQPAATIEDGALGRRRSRRRPPALRLRGKLRLRSSAERRQTPPALARKPARAGYLSGNRAAQARAGPWGDPNALRTELADFVGAADLAVPLRHRTRESERVGFLKGVGADQAVETWPLMQTTGTESDIASSSPVMVLLTPGPEVTSTTPGFPVVRA